MTTWKFYKDRRHLWRWKRKATHGRVTRVVEESRKGFPALKECEDDATEAGWDGQVENRG